MSKPTVVTAFYVVIALAAWLQLVAVHYITLPGANVSSSCFPALSKEFVHAQNIA